MESIALTGESVVRDFTVVNPLRYWRCKECKKRTDDRTLHVKMNGAGVKVICFV